MIVLNLKDGLGNQLFEYAYARQLQMQTNEPIAINTYFFRRLKDRRPSLQNYNLNKNVVFLTKGQEIIYTLLFYLKLISCLGLKRMWKWVVHKQRPRSDAHFIKYASRGLYYSFVTFNDCAYVKSQAVYKFIHGNYESKQYLAGIEDVINQELVLQESLTSSQLELLSKISKCNAVCVHIRRGDYLDPQWAAFNVCTYEYYKAGMDILQRRLINPIFFIFSNTHADIEWIKKNFHFDCSMKICFVDCESTDVQDFELMRNCKHFIIANSTYSWWAANLARNTDKCVIAPKVWCKGAANCETMYCTNWIRI